MNDSTQRNVEALSILIHEAPEGLPSQRRAQNESSATTAARLTL